MKRFTNHLAQQMRQHPLVSFYLMAFGWTWLIDVVILSLWHPSSGAGGDAVRAVLAAVLGAPTFPALLMTMLTEGRAGVGQLWCRCTLWRVGLRWYLLVLIGFPALILLGLLVDHPDGHDIISGEPLAVYLNSTWIEGHVEGSNSYNGSGCYNISDTGRLHRGPGKTTDPMSHEPLSQETLRQRVQAAQREVMSLADALDAAAGKASALFTRYYFIANDGNVCGLCTGMKVRYYR